MSIRPENMTYAQYVEAHDGQLCQLQTPPMRTYLGFWRGERKKRFRPTHSEQRRIRDIAVRETEAMRNMSPEGASARRITRTVKEASGAVGIGVSIWLPLLINLLLRLYDQWKEEQ